MSKSYILVIDSGIGGLSVLRDLEKSLPNENFIYVGDNENVPYGNKSKRELLSLSFYNIMLAIDYKIKAIVLACNTLSMAIRCEVEYLFEVPVFAVFPPIEQSLIKGESTLIVATPNTIKSVNKINGINTLALDNLAKHIECNAFSLDKLDLTPHITKLYKYRGIDTLIIGCTHYNFIKNQFIDHFCPKKIVSGHVNTINQIIKYISSLKSSVFNCKNEILFLGKNSLYNKDFYFKVVKNCF